MPFRFHSDSAKFPLPKRRARFESLARAAFKAFSSRGLRVPGDVNVVWVSRGKIADLNKKFRGVDSFTDVISFRYESARPIFGDLYVSVGQARLNALKFKAPLLEELLRLAVHGTLHLLGYTDYAAKPQKRMWALQEDILRSVVPGLVPQKPRRVKKR